MKYTTLILVFCFIFFSKQSIGQTIWTGATIVFTKEVGADFTLPENQDALTTNVIITRGDSRGLYNIATETVAEFGCDSTSPHDTEWALGTIADYDTLTYDTFINTSNCGPPSLLNVPMVLHLISDDIYLDVTITIWSVGVGGGFSYTRSTPSTVSVNDLESVGFNYFPNPVTNKLTLQATKNITNVSIFNMLGQKVKQIYPENSSSIAIDMSNLTNGTYFVNVEINNAPRTFNIIKK